MSELTQANPADRHREVAAEFTRLAEGVRDWTAPTPVKEWQASDVVEHLTSWLPGFLAHMAHTTLDVPRESGDQAAAFRAQSAAVQQLLDSPDAGRLVETPMFGTMPLNRLIDQFYTADVFMHSWDLAKASGQLVQMDADWANEMRVGMEAMGDKLTEGGMFGQPVPVADDADPIDRLVARIGRDPQWTP